MTRRNGNGRLILRRCARCRRTLRDHEEIFCTRCQKAQPPNLGRKEPAMRDIAAAIAAAEANPCGCTLCTVWNAETACTCDLCGTLVVPEHDFIEITGLVPVDRPPGYGFGICPDCAGPELVATIRSVATRVNAAVAEHNRRTEEILAAMPEGPLNVWDC